MDCLHTRLLTWYDRHARNLPWRISPQDGKSGVVANPYHVWLSEVMLQQTTVATVKSYFEKFVRQWPTVEALAASEPDDVMKAWAGLGYYSRARNLKACADIVATQLGGRFPQSAAELQKLPGIGAYTSAAIAAIAFGHNEPVVDGNIERVSCRLRADDTPLPAAKANCRQFMEENSPDNRPGDFAQAMMDLGATICTPKSPACALCPLQSDCAAYKDGTQLQFPVKAAKKPKPTRIGAAFVAERDDGAIWLTKRPEKGLLGGMATVPTTAWTAAQNGETSSTAAPVEADWLHQGIIRHTFTHFHLELTVWSGKVETMAGEGWWSPQTAIASEALPTVFKKVIVAVRRDAFR